MRGHGDDLGLDVAANEGILPFNRGDERKPGGPKHSISAVGRDGTGAILFILCREPITGVDFGALLLALPIDVRVVMYTEGGSLAGLFLRTPVRSQIWLGRSLPEFWASGSQGAPLPNVIGVRRKS